jgi:KamA family protein
MSSIAPLQASDRRMDAPAFKVYSHRQMDKITQLDKLPQSLRFETQVVANVFPFRVNGYVLNELIDWDNVPDDPMFRLVFPQRDMLQPEQFGRIADLVAADVSAAELRQAVDEVRASMNPHPAGQMELNVPEMEGGKLAGMQHKYNDTVLFFPSQGQVCHSYCTFCFRWAQFVGDKDLRFAAKESEQLLAYLKQHKEVSDLLLTGGDPMVMKASNLKPYLEGLLSPGLEHVQTLRIGTKSLSFWPHRFISDPDAAQLLKQLETLVNAGKHVAVMAHYNHWRELDTAAAQEAVRLVRSTGAEIRSQGPLLANINDDAADWSTLWRAQTRLGIIPYYMFVERDTGAQHYFEVPLARAWHIYRDAMQSVSGLGRTARGPSMSAGPGKVEVQGVTEIQGEKVFVLRFIQGRNKQWVQRPFLAKYDENATWLDQLEPAFGEDRFFFEDEYRAMLADG